MKRERAFWPGVFFVLVAAVFICYWPLLFSGFWKDDLTFLQVVPPFHPRDLPEFFSPLRGWFYRPVFLVYFALLRRVFGDNPVAFHAAGLVLHALNLTLLAALVRRLAGRSRAAVFAIAAALVGLLFYPGIAERDTNLGDTGISAVVWISSASTLLATLFSLLCLHFWLSFLRHGERRFYGAALVAFCLALISKEDAATLPLALLILDFAFGAPRAFGRRVREYAPFFVAFVLFAVLDIVAYKHYQVPQVFGNVGLGGPVRLARYRLALMFLNRVLLDHWSSDTLWMMAGIAAIGVWAWRCDRAAAFFWGWLCVAALPAPLMSGPHALAARFYYLPAFAAVPAVMLTLRGLAGEKSDKACDRALVPLTLLAASLALPVRMWSLPVFVDPAFVWTAMVVLLVVGGLLWRIGEWPGALFLALILSFLGSQFDIYGPETGFVGFWPLLCLPVAAFVFPVIARRERGGTAGAWLALSLSWSQPVIFWSALVIVIACRRAAVGVFRRSIPALPVT